MGSEDVEDQIRNIYSSSNSTTWMSEGMELITREIRCHGLSLPINRVCK